VPQTFPLITLLTDFGDRDWFVASMKGVILSINPQATIVDLSHHIPSHDLESGAFVLHSCYRNFPHGTIHVAVVDPGVGGARRPLLASTDRYHFVAPDNGLLTYVLEEAENAEIRVIENRRYLIEPLGRTFDGRDVFAPAAAWLAKGESPASFGSSVADVVRIQLQAPSWDGQTLIGEVVYVDKFGNLITNVTRHHVEQVLKATGRPKCSVFLGEHRIHGLVTSYGEGSLDSPHALINSNGYLEVFFKEADAASRLHVCRHEIVKLA